MAVVELTRVVVRAPASELGRLLARLIASGEFHPARREGMVQDIQILLLASQAQDAYGRADELLGSAPFVPDDRGGALAPGYQEPDLARLLSRFEQDLDVVARSAPLVEDPADRAALAAILRSIRSTSLEVFHALSRLVVVPGPAHSATIEGYVPTLSVERFRAVVQGYLLTAEPVPRRGQDDPYVPTLLVNPKAISLFERFVLERGIPRYSEVDPTPIVALVFPLFFGVMFGDVGHGLALLALGGYLARRTRYAYWGALLATFGVSATIVGFLRGVVFGVTFPSPFAWLLPLPPALSASLTLAYVPLWIEVSVVVGTFHLASAYAISILNQARSRQWGDLLTGGVPTLVLYASLVPFGFAVLGTGLHPAEVFASPASTPFFRQFLGVNLPVAAVALWSAPFVLGALVALLLGPWVRRLVARRRLRHSAAALLDGATLALSRPVEFALNTLSYIRLGALLITNTLLSGLVAGTLAYGWPGYAVAALLNVGLMAMEGLIVYLQDMRLHWLEWLPKFYAGTGTAFKPLAAPFVGQPPG